MLEKHRNDTENLREERAEKAEKAKPKTLATADLSRIRTGSPVFGSDNGSVGTVDSKDDRQLHVRDEKDELHVIPMGWVASVDPAPVVQPDLSKPPLDPDNPPNPPSKSAQGSATPQNFIPSYAQVELAKAQAAKATDEAACGVRLDRTADQAKREWKSERSDREARPPATA